MNIAYPALPPEAWEVTTSASRENLISLSKTGAPRLASVENVLWHLFEDDADLFEWSGRRILYNFSLSDGALAFRPHASFTVAVNPPPSVGTISLTPLTAASSPRSVSIAVSGFADAHQPILYQVSYYLSGDARNADKLNLPYLTQRYILSDFSAASSYSLLIPRPSIHSSNNMQRWINQDSFTEAGWVLISARDALGAVSNLTASLSFTHQCYSEQLSDYLARVATLLAGAQSSGTDSNEKILQINAIALDIYQVDATVRTDCYNQGSYDAETNCCQCSEGRYLGSCQADLQLY